MARAVLKKLVDLKFITEQDAENVQKEHVNSAKTMTSLLVEKNYVSEEALLGVMAEVLGISMTPDLGGWRASVEYIQKVPIDFSRQYSIIGLAGNGGKIEIATADPFDTFPIDEASMLMGRVVTPVIAPREAIRTFISDAYEMDLASVDSVLGSLESNDLAGLTKEVSENEDLADMANAAPIVKLINTLLFQSLKMRASDIHVQPYEKHVQVRFRVDGILHDIMRVPKPVQEAVISRIKVMGKMDIAERRLPQDGQTSFIAGGREVDVRISTIPSAHGERVVMRIQDKSTGIYRLDKVGLLEEDYNAFLRLINMAHGIILVTGPTGSGKTTTLYAALTEINHPDKNIITVEDPIEYLLPGISQIQVAVKKGMTFATGLRHIVRQDPDIIMVGEIRDIETAGISIQSALTGHLVFSTLHTNDAPGAVSRMLDLGAEPFLVNSSLLAVVAQRLVRKVCEYCAEEYSPDSAQLAGFGLKPDDVPDGKLVKGAGCDQCSNTGYVGRMGIYEILSVDDAVKDQIMRRASAAEIKKSAVERGLRTLRMDGVHKALMGLTTLDEVQRVTQMDIV